MIQCREATQVVTKFYYSLTSSFVEVNYWSFSFCVDTENYYLAATTMQNMAAVCLKIGRHDLALQFCDRALAIATELNIPLVKECQEFKEQLIRQHGT